MSQNAQSDSIGHVFLSYVHEDTVEVDRLVAVLAAQGISVWRDRNNLWPGQTWKAEIRKAITQGSLAFVACFSRTSVAKEKSYQNEELNLALDEIRLHPPGRVWLFPVRFDEVDLPQWDFGHGQSINDLQRADLFGNRRDQDLLRLVQMITEITGSAVQVPIMLPAPSNLPIRQEIQQMLSDPARQIQLENRLVDIARAVKVAVANVDEFPTAYPRPVEHPEIADIRYLVQRADTFGQLAQPLAEALAVGCAWGTVPQEQLWTRALKTLSVSRGPGGRPLVAIQRLPPLIAMYAGAMGALNRKNYEALRAITTDLTARTPYGKETFIAAMHTGSIVEDMAIVGSTLQTLSEGQPSDDAVLQARIQGTGGRVLQPVSSYLKNTLRPIVMALVSDEEEFDDLFTATEVWLSLIAEDSKLEAQKRPNGYEHGMWGGIFVWQNEFAGPDRWPEVRLRQEFSAAGGAWAPLQAGLFGGSAPRADAAFKVMLPQAKVFRQNRL